MKAIHDLTMSSLWDSAFDSEKIPEIELYMDQILSLIEEKGVTKTMINNYSKERLLKPVKGKKYTKEQIIQILCIMNLKQSLSMSSIRSLMPQEEGVIDFCKVYDVWEEENDRLAEAAAAFVEQNISVKERMSKEEEALTAAMMLSSCCAYFINICETMIKDE